MTHGVKRKSFETSRMKRLKVTPVPIPFGAHHPEPKCYPLPTHEFSMGIIAPKGSGKTTLMVNLLKFYAGYFHSIFIFSPTIKNDEKWDYVKKQKLLVENKELKAWLKKMHDEDTQYRKNKIIGDPPVTDALAGLVDVNLLAGGERRDHDDKFDGLIPEGNFISEYDEGTLVDLLSSQQKVIDILHQKGKSKHLANRCLFLFDDLVGSDLYGQDRKNPFKMFNTNHRHLSSSILMVSQAYKEIQKTVRTNFTCLIVFEIFSDGELEAIYNEYPMGMKKKQWMDMFAHCIKGEHNFLFYDIQKPKAMRIMKNFDSVIYFKDEGHLKNSAKNSSSAASEDAV